MLDNHPKLKSFLHYLLVHPYTSRPRWWARTFIIPFVITILYRTLVQKATIKAKK